MMTEKQNNYTFKYSVIFIVEDRNRDVLRFVKDMYDLFSSRSDSFEMIIIANGTGGFVKNMLMGDPVFAGKIKALEMSSKASQAICLKSILNECSGEFFVVSGSYQQLMLESYGKLLDSVDVDTDILSPWRQHRFDHSIYKMQSSVFNALVRWITGFNMHDLSCNVRIFRREILEQIDLYGNMYRFLPIFSELKGFKNKEVKCEHYKEHGEPRKAHAGFYFLSIYLSRIIDIFTLYFNTSFAKKPLRFFSSIGIVSIMIGATINFILFLQKILYGQNMALRPLFILAIFLLVVGVQSAGMGLLGEIIAFTHGRRKKEYIIEKII